MEDNALHSIITSRTILFFDLDGTLIETSRLNNYAYCEAFRVIMGNHLPKTYAIRINRQVINNISGFCPEALEAIINEKKRIYSKNLSLATPLNRIVDILKHYCSDHKTYLTTKGSKDRVIETLNFFDLSEYFNEVISCDFKNKYRYAIDILNVEPTDIVVFEDDDKEIDNCMKAGILKENIIKVDD